MASNVSPSYYDKILAAIGVSLGAGSLAGVLTPISFRIGLLAGALIATIPIYDALFRNPPQPPASKARVAAVVWHAFLALLLLPSYL